jgi:hypothetical protein
MLLQLNKKHGLLNHARASLSQLSWGDQNPPEIVPEGGKHIVIP